MQVSLNFRISPSLGITSITTLSGTAELPPQKIGAILAFIAMVERDVIPRIGV